MMLNINSLVVNVGDDGRVELAACNDAGFAGKFAFAVRSADDALSRRCCGPRVEGHERHRAESWPPQ
jgi:hypothetical protein